MSERLHLPRPLEVDGWEVIESLEGLSLFDFDGYRDCTNDAITLLHEVQGIWREHQGEDGEWSEQATCVVSDVMSLAFNIRQSHQRYGEPLSDHVRSSLGLYDASSISNAQLEAAMAMSSACMALRLLANWLERFEIELYRVRPDLVALIEKQDPEGFAALVERQRGELVLAESEALEGVRRHLSEASIYLAGARGVLREVAALDSVRKKKSEAGKRAGEFNRNPGSAAQKQKEATRSTIKEKADGILRNRPGVSRREMVSALLAAGVASRPTIKKHLDELNILVEEK